MDSKSLSSVQIKNADEGRVEAVFSTFGVIDHDGDMTDPNAFTHGSNVLISSYNHKSWDGALPVGKGVIEVGSKGATLKGQFFMNTQAGRDTFETVKALAESGMGEWSYGFEVEDSAQESIEGKSVRVLKKLKVYEVSPVIKGAGVGTRTMTVKALQAGFTLEEVENWLEEKNAQRGYGKDKDPKKKPKDDDEESEKDPKKKPKDDEESEDDEDEDDKKPRKPKKTSSLVEEIDEAADVVTSVIESVERVVALRAEANKQLSRVNVESLAGLHEALVKLDDVLSTHIETKDATTDAEKEYLRYVAFNLERE